VFELGRYLARVGLSGRPGVAEVHRAHITSIPFENLDPHRDLLAERFGLDGFALGEGDRIVRAAGG
jgi:arylamine N-acetyltransferase